MSGLGNGSRSTYQPLETPRGAVALRAGTQLCATTQPAGTRGRQRHSSLQADGTATCLFLHPCGSHLERRSSQRPRDALVPVALGCRLKAEASSAPLQQITLTCTDLPSAVFIPPMAHILHKSTHTHSHVLASCLTTEPWWHSTAAGRCSQPPPASAVWRSGAWHGEKRIKESNAYASAEDYAADLNLC